MASGERGFGATAQRHVWRLLHRRLLPRSLHLHQGHQSCGTLPALLLAGKLCYLVLYTYTKGTSRITMNTSFSASGRQTVTMWAYYTHIYQGN